MKKKRKAKKRSSRKGSWLVTFTDGKSVKTGYYPNPRMAVGYAVTQHKGKVKSVRFVK